MSIFNIGIRLLSFRLIRLKKFLIAYLVKDKPTSRIIWKELINKSMSLNINHPSRSYFRAALCEGGLQP